jgi:predicted O-methyltransferase YrrM
MKLKGLDNIVYPLRLPSHAAAHILHCYQIQADVVFIDADHDYNAVVRDIQLYYPLVRKDGIFMGHDYDWKGKLFTKKSAI